MNGKRNVLLLFGLVLLIALPAACGPKAPIQAPADTRMPAAATQVAAPARATSVPAPPPPTEEVAMPPPAEEDGSGRARAAPEYFSMDPSRMIIKDAEIKILVEHTDAAIDRVIGIATQYGGYLTGMSTWFEDGYKEASVVIAVPAQHFEQVLRRVRDVAVHVQEEMASGYDVTDEYVDLESQLRNLEATAERIRSFLDRAETVEQALQVNEELSAILGEIEVIKGQMNYVSERSAYSTITVEIRQPRPTPTPTPTPTSTPIPTVTPTPTSTPTPTPVVWRPSETYQRASDTLGSAGRFLWEAAIWLGVVVIPMVGAPVVVIGVVAWAARRWSNRNQRDARQHPQS